MSSSPSALRAQPGKRQKRSNASPPPLRESAEEAIRHFLETLEGEGCTELYEMVQREVEEPLFRAVLEYTQNNQSYAATMLGLNRGTLRKKLRQHGLLDEPAPPQPKRTNRNKRPTTKRSSTHRKR